MRPLEWTVFGLCALYLIGLFLPATSRPAAKRPAALALLPTLALLASLLQLGLEGYRWQMLPLYIFPFLLSLSRLLTLRPEAAAAPERLNWLALAGLALLVIAALPAVLFPVPKVAPPSGAYPVGTATFELVDDSRRELYSGNPDEPRRLLIQVWYPAQPGEGAQLAPWLEHVDQLGPAIAEWIGLPSFFLDHLSLARSRAYLDAPLVPGSERFPVLLFSHGWGGFRAQNTSQVQELASHGYVVVGVEHTYAAVGTVFLDGTLAAHNPATLPGGAPEAEYDTAARRLVDQWAGDLAFVTDTLAGWNESDPGGRFTGRLDLARLGVFGHSTGGGAAIEFCARDPRCQAGLGMDAFMTPVSAQTLQNGLSQPFLFLFSERWPSEKNKQLFEALFANSSGSASHLIIQGTAHYDFTDLPLLTPIAAQIGLKGPLAGGRVLEIVKSYSLSFFEAQFRGGSPALYQSPSAEYPEVTFLKGR